MAVQVSHLDNEKHRGGAGERAVMNGSASGMKGGVHSAPLGDTSSICAQCCDLNSI